MMEYKGYLIEESHRHGKCVKGEKKTSSIQVNLPFGNGSYLNRKNFSFPVDDLIKREKAIEKAKKFIDEEINKKII